MSAHVHLFPATPHSYRIGESTRQCLSTGVPEGPAHRPEISPGRLPRRSMGYGGHNERFNIREKGNFFPSRFSLAQSLLLTLI